MISPPFERSVFVNCPFDEEYAPILQAIAFCIIALGFFPRLAPENADNAVGRLDRIIELVKGSKYGIHDLSRCKATKAKEYARMNMPFELGIDHGCKRFGELDKSILILEQSPRDYQRALSDIAGWDINAHEGEYQKAVRHVRDWLVRHAQAAPVGTTRILDWYTNFLSWHVERERKRGASDEDIKAYPTIQMISTMMEWYGPGLPIRE